MHGVGVSQLAQCVVEVASAEELLFHLTEQRRADLGVGADVGERLVEAFRDHGESTCSIEHVAGSLLDEEEVVGGTTVGIRRAGDGKKC